MENENGLETIKPTEPKPIKDMTDSEKLDEILFWLRQTGAALAQIQQQGIGSMMKMFMGNGKAK